VSAAVTREWLVRDQLGRLPWGSRGFPTDAPPVRIGATGTGDGLLVLGWTASELAREREAGARLLRALGVAPGMRVANTLAGALATPGALLLGDVVEELGALDVPLGVPDTEAAARGGWALADRVACDVLILDPATAAAFLAARAEAARPWWKGVVWLRTERTPAPPALDGFAGWRRTWLAVPEAASFVAGSCAAGRFHPVGGLAADVVDDQLVVGVPAGTRPALAYRTTLAARRADGCACGAAGAAFEIP
jgi:hypothetical protein